MKETLGARIAAIRKEKGLTQEDFAQRLGVSGQAVSKWENDQTCPDISLLPTIARMGGMTVDSLLTGEVLEPTAIVVPEALRKNSDQLMLRIIVDSCDKGKVRINIPLTIIKLALEAGMGIPEVSTSIKGLEKVDFSKVIMLAENGMLGNIMEVESSDGDTIYIRVE